MLVPGVVAISIMFQGIQAVALQLSAEFGYTREIEDRRAGTLPDLAGGRGQGALRRRAGADRRVIVFPIAAVVHAPGVHAHLTVHWAVRADLDPARRAWR